MSLDSEINEEDKANQEVDADDVTSQEAGDGQVDEQEVASDEVAGQDIDDSADDAENIEEGDVNSQETAPADEDNSDTNSSITAPEEPLISDAEAYERLSAFGDIDVKLHAVLGTVDMSIEQFLKLGKGAIVKLEQPKDTNLQLRVNNHHIGEGEIMVIDKQINVNILKIGVDDKNSDDMDMSSAMEEMDMGAAMEGGDDMSAAMEESK